MKTFYFILWFLIIELEVWRNYYIIEVKKQAPSYLLSFILRSMAAIVYGILFNPQNFNDYSPILIFQVTSFWIVFDLSLNILRDKEIFYTGHESGWLDKLGKIPLLYLFLKLSAFALMIFSIITIYKRPIP